MTKFNDFINEMRQKDKNVYWETYSAAIVYVHDEVSKKFKIDDDEWFNQLGTGGKPDPGKTKKGIITIYDPKTEKKLKKALAIQVYNRGTNHDSFELNWYIS